MDGFYFTEIAPKLNYWAYITLMMIGLWAMIAKTNLVKKVIGMNIFQTAIILFYVSIGAKLDATIPILTYEDAHGSHGAQEGHEGHGDHVGHVADHAADHSINAMHDAAHGAISAMDYINPLPHVLMLTAIVVSVATLGVALTLMLKVYQRHNTLDEDEILKDLGE